MTFFGGLGHVERAPDYWELISKEGRASLSAFETRPEKTTQLDTGMLYRRGAVSASVAMFVSDSADFILIKSNYPKAPAMGASSMGAGMGPRRTTIARNVDATTLGGEASLAWEATHRLKLDASLAYVRGQNHTDDRPLAQLAPLEGRLGLQYSSERWSLGVLSRLVAAQNRYALHQGNIVGQDLGPTEAFGVVSLNGAWDVRPSARLTTGVDNLLDRTYAEFISRGGAEVPGFAISTRVNEPGRTLWIKLALRY